MGLLSVMQVLWMACHFSLELLVVSRVGKSFTSLEYTISMVLLYMYHARLKVWKVVISISDQVKQKTQKLALVFLYFNLELGAKPDWSWVRIMCQGRVKCPPADCFILNQRMACFACQHSIKRVYVYNKLNCSQYDISISFATGH